MTNTKMSKGKKILLLTISTIASMLVIVFVSFFIIFFNEIGALFSIKKIDTGIHTMTYNNNYYFQDFLEVGAKNDAELISFVTKKLLKGLPITIDLPNIACSSFTSTTPDKDKLHSRNFDLGDTPFLILETNPKDAYSSISTINLDFLGYNFNYLPETLFSKVLLLAAPYIPLDGINEKGLAISVNMLKGEPANQNTDKIDITTTTLIRLVLDYADSVESAIELISQYDIHDSAFAPYHYQISDKEGNSAIIEYINNEMKVIPQTGSFLHQTNFILYDPRIADDFGRARYDIITAQLRATKGITTEEEAMNLLEAAISVREGGGTQWSIVYNLTNLTATYCAFSDFTRTFDFSL